MAGNKKDNDQSALPDTEADARELVSQIFEVYPNIKTEYKIKHTSSAQIRRAQNRYTDEEELAVAYYLDSKVTFVDLR